MLTDYKISWLIRQDDGSIEMLVRFHEGEVTTEMEITFHYRGDVITEVEEEKLVTRYRRTRMIREETFRWPPMSEDEMHERLWAELGQDRTRTPIVEQRNA